MEKRLLRSDAHFFHDRFSMVIFRVRDMEGHPVTDYDLILTAGEKADPNHLPRGFFADKQRNNNNKETITFFLNYDVMVGTDEVVNDEGEILRESQGGAEMFGFKIIPRPNSGFVHYGPCEIKAGKDVLEEVLIPNGTTLVDIRLQRVVHSNVFRLERGTRKRDFKDTKPGRNLV